MDKILNHPIWNTHALLLARILMGALFIVSGLQKLQGIEATAGYVASAGLPFPMLLAWISAFVELGAGAALILGKYFREAAIVLAGFVVLTSLFFHNPNSWAPDNMQQLLFSKNMAILAGLLFMAAHGAGRTWTLGSKK